MSMRRVVMWFVVLSLALPARARAETLAQGLFELVVDGGNNYHWEKVALPGTQCGNGSQYKFFVRRTPDRPTCCSSSRVRARAGTSTPAAGAPASSARPTPTGSPTTT